MADNGNLSEETVKAEGNATVGRTDDDETRNIFGSDSESEDDESGNVEPQKVTETSSTDPSKNDAMKSIFGDDDSDSDLEIEKSNESIDEQKPDVVKKEIKEENNMDFMYEEGDDTKPLQSKQATHAKLCITDTRKLSHDTKTFSLRLPNFLKLQTNSYNKQLHQEESESSLFAGATSMIRWRFKLNQNGDIETDQKGVPIRESNTRLVKWSDGSYQVLVGQEVFDSSTFPVIDSYLYTQRKSALPDESDPASSNVKEEDKEEVKTDTCLECVGSSSERLVLRPSSVVSAAHARLSLAISEKYSRKTKIKDREYGSVIINAEKDTDARAAAINEDLRREKRRRAQAESSQSGGRYSKPSMSSRFMEEDEEGFDSTSLRDIKKGKKFKPSRSYGDDDDDDELEDEEDDDDDGFIVNDEDMEDEEGDEGGWGGESGNESDVKKEKTVKKEKKTKKAAPKEESDSDQENISTARQKKRSQDSNLDDSLDNEDDIPTQKKRRRAVVDSDEDE